MINIAFERNMKNLQRVIEFLSDNLDDDTNKELLRIGIAEYRQWTKMILDYEDKITEEPKEDLETMRNNIHKKVIQVFKNIGMPLRWINKYNNEWKKHRWNHIRKGLNKYET